METIDELCFLYDFPSFGKRSKGGPHSCSNRIYNRESVCEAINERDSIEEVGVACSLDQPKAVEQR